MDLIYADKNKIDIGVLEDYSFDLAFGSDENDFELIVSSNNHVCTEDYLVYIENTEYGGIIDSIIVDTTQKQVTYSGRTFHGILAKKIISPNDGQAYRIVSGDANQIIADLITILHLDTFFTASAEASINITNYQFDRYVDAYTGLKAMLASVNYKLNMNYSDGMVILSAVPLVLYDNEIDSDLVNFKIQKTYNPVNHLVCLGQGELQDRTVIHLYMDADGNVSQTQSYTNIEEIVEVYDYPNVESEDELIKDGIKKLKEQDTNNVEVTLGSSVSFDIGDKITASDTITGLVVTRSIIKKIVTIEKNVLKVNYKVGE